MKAPKLPETPDPTVVSEAQTQSNQDTAAYNNAITHGNTTTPYGSQTYTARVDPVTGATVYDQNVSVDQSVQDTINAQNQQDLALANTGTGMLGQVSEAYKNPMDTSGIPDVQQLPGMERFNTNAGQNDQLDLNGLPELFGANDLLGARQQVQDALYQQQSRYLDPQYQQADQALRTEAANKGVVEGSEQWNRMRDQFARDKSFDYGSARDRAITGGGAEMGNLANIALGNRGQAFGERVTAGNFGNQARLTNADFGNQAIGANNQAAVTSTGFNNNAAKDALARAVALRNQPLNEYSALRSGTQVSVPQFQNAQNAMVAPTDTAGNVWNAYQGNMQQAQMKNSASNAVLSGLFGLGSSALSNPAIFTSDARLKTDIVRIDVLPNGLPYYSFRYKGEHYQQYGVLAQEVMKVMPEAVFTAEDGFYAVDYRLVLGLH